MNNLLRQQLDRRPNGQWYLSGADIFGDLDKLYKELVQQVYPNRPFVRPDHPDVLLIGAKVSSLGDQGETTISSCSQSVADMEKVIEFSRYAPMELPRKLAIFIGAPSVIMQNKLLKFWEAPAVNLCSLVLIQQASELLQTVRSRLMGLHLSAPETDIDINLLDNFQAYQSEMRRDHSTPLRLASLLLEDWHNTTKRYEQLSCAKLARAISQGMQTLTDRRPFHNHAASSFVTLNQWRRYLTDSQGATT